MTRKEREAAKKKTAARREKVGKALRVWRKGADLVLVQVAAKIKVSQGSLSDLENGKCFPSFMTMLTLRKKFPDADWDSILFG